MNVSEAITAADDLRPGNRISTEIKRMWLNGLERKIYENVILTHEGEHTRLPDYRTEDAVLLIPDTYSEVYVWFLISQIDAALGETERHNTSAERYNSLYAEFLRWYNRTHLPKQPPKIHSVLKRRGIL